MHFSNILTPILLTISLLLSTFACNLYARQDTGSPSQVTFGEDGPVDSATLGYNLDHFCLIVSNLTDSMHFYGRVLGMRHIFTVQVTPVATITYMSFSHGRKNGTGFQTADELYKEKNNAQGQVELLNFVGAGPAHGYDPVPSTVKTNTFGHAGLIVPDVKAARTWIEKFKVPVLKLPGADYVTMGSPFANALGVPKEAIPTQKGIDELVKGLTILGFENLLFVQDPDENLVEIIQQDSF